jgi:hypothetical protein
MLYMSVAELYAARGEAGLRELPGVGKSLAGEIARWLQKDNNEFRNSFS